MNGCDRKALNEESLLRLASSPTSRRERGQLFTAGEGGLQLGVDIDDSASLLDAMERPRDSWGVAGAGDS